jgi:hypothetical protein
MKVQLVKLAHARSGDKGDTANVGIMALKDEYYPLLTREVTAAAVKSHFGEMVKGDGGTLSLMTDAQGKTFSTALLRMFIEVPDDEAATLSLAS